MSTRPIQLTEVNFVTEDYSSLKAHLRPGLKVAVLGGKTALGQTQAALQSALAEWQPSFTVYGSECTRANVERLAQTEAISQAEILIGVGGGKALDSAKAVAEYLGIPVITVPTLASTCAATSAITVYYNEDHSFESMLGLSQPPLATYLPLEVLAQAPVRYVWAGIGDTLAKPLEIEFSVRNLELSVEEALAKQISGLCLEQCLRYGEAALMDAKTGRVSEALKQTVFTILATTGYASCLIDPDLSGSLAHALNNALTRFEVIEKEHLHGEVVSLGVLVLTVVDGQTELFHRLLPFYQAIGLPRKLSDLGIPLVREDLGALLADTVNGEEMRIGAYPVSEEQLYQALAYLESL